jgi:DNA-binding response OmpR family regulator
MKPFVLIVDDEFGLAEMSAELLVEDGFDVAIAINGKLGLAAMKALTVDVVMTDLMMPVMDGLEMIRHIRADANLARIPVVLMTALPEAVPGDGESSHDALLVKPFSARELIDTVRRLTSR